MAEAGCKHAPLFSTDDGSPIRAWCWRCKLALLDRDQWARELMTDPQPRALERGRDFIDTRAFIRTFRHLIEEVIENGPDAAREMEIAAFRVRDRLIRRGILEPRIAEDGRTVFVYADGPVSSGGLMSYAA